QDVEETVADTIEDVKDAAEEALNKAEDVAEEVAETAEDVADDVVDAAAGAADSVKEKVEKQTKGVWDQEVLKKYDWKKIWGYPAYFCLFWAVIFLLLGSEPKSPEDAE
ncbi:MAG: hypothetical protein Q4G03_06445, partial [Planctomycetia bacterium]|nr:hypothetical protein [Planctomycetia bacterium]